MDLSSKISSTFWSRFCLQWNTERLRDQLILSFRVFLIFRIRLGEWDVNNDSEFYTHIEFDATNMFIHEEFYPGNLYNDLAMIRLKGYVDFTRNPHVSPVCLPDLHENFAGYRCHVSGWGKDAFEAGSYQHVLKEGT